MELWSSHLPRSGSGKNNLMRRPHLRRRFSFRFHPMWNDFHMFLTAKNPYMILYVSLQPCPSCKLHYSIVANSTSVRFQSPYNTSRPIMTYLAYHSLPGLLLVQTYTLPHTRGIPLFGFTCRSHPMWNDWN